MKSLDADSLQADSGIRPGFGVPVCSQDRLSRCSIFGATFRSSINIVIYLRKKVAPPTVQPFV